MSHRQASGIAAAAVVVLLSGGAPAAQGAGTPRVRLNTVPESPHFGTVEVADLAPRLFAELARQGLSAEDWRKIFPVYTGTEPPADGSKPPVLGSYAVADGVIRFQPRFPLVAGLAYGARLDLTTLGADAPAPLWTSFSLPAGPSAPSTVVERIYPSGDRLPENLLRLYLHFSAPMSRGEAYGHIHLLDEAGEDVPAPFVEIEQELWDPRMRRLTVFFDPGRIKRGLRPHLEAGLPLVAGRSYRLVIDADWLDAESQLLKEGFEKRFTVTAADRTSPDPADWRLTVPAAGSRRPLELRFPEPLDRGLLERVLWVRGGGGQVVAGRIDVGDHETRWSFTPEESWRAGDYRIEVETILEDVAGNNLLKVFDVDLRDTAAEAPSAERISLPFTVTAAGE